MSATPWHGLDLTPDEQARSSEAIACVADELADWAPTDRSLALGGAGVALLFAHLADAQDSDAHAERAVRLSEDALAEAVGMSADAGLHEGLTGPAWMLAHLDGWLVEVEDDDPNDVVDESVLDLLDQPTWDEHFDLISGFVGLGVYALERLPRPNALRTLECIVAHLEASADRNARGITWHTAPHLLPEHRRAESPRGCHDLGVAHGVPGVIGLLASICEAGVAQPVASDLLTGAVTWLLNQQLPGGGFPSVVHPEQRPRPARSAWCYGDPGVAAMLLRAAAATDRRDWADIATRIALHAAARPLDDCGVTDAGICHGAAGLALVYSRLWQGTGDDRLHAAAEHWLVDALDRLPAMRAAGMLEGRAGVALVLLAAAGSEPTWDRTLLLSARER